MKHRKLNYHDLDAAMAECKRLLASGYEKHGNWSLGQICQHIRLTMQSNMDGYPLWMTILGFPLRPILARMMLPKLLRGQSPKGVPTAPMYVPPGDLDDAAEVELLDNCIAQFLNFPGRLHAHPGFGNLSRSDFAKFHAAHLSHHLNFLSSRDPGAGTTGD